MKAARTALEQSFRSSPAVSHSGDLVTTFKRFQVVANGINIELVEIVLDGCFRRHALGTRRDGALYVPIRPIR